MSKWHFWIDTGGTFTDCIAISPEGKKYQNKYLSSGELKSEFYTDNDELKLKDDFGLSKDILKGYQVIDFSNPKVKAEITYFNPLTKVIRLNKNLKNRSGSLSISANEEAPVLAMRMITETSLFESIPPVELKLGTTKSTNALLENKITDTLLIVTKGFKDLLNIGSQQRPFLFQLGIIKPQNLYKWVFELEESINAQGDIVKQIDEEELSILLDQIDQLRPQSIAISLKNAYKNNTNELILEERLKERGYNFISVSSQLSESIGYLDRTNTAVINGVLDPVLKTYLKGISENISDDLFQVMSSSGGLSQIKSYRAKDSLLSGPAGGVAGVKSICKYLEIDNGLAFDMGGTSTDVSKYSGEIDYVEQHEVGNAKINTTAVNIHTVAAGGGSICGYKNGEFFVGPESAGAFPGPACYGNGGPFSITDVNLLLGRLDSDKISIPLDKSAAEKELELLIELSGSSRLQILTGFLQLANEKMAEAIKTISSAKGYSTEDFKLIAFGGAGGMHACDIADLLNVKEIIIPNESGVLSAFGIGNSYLNAFSKVQILKKLKDFKSKVAECFLGLEKSAKSKLEKQNVISSKIIIESKTLALRFTGQDSFLEIKYTNHEQLIEDFESTYRSIYGYWVTNREIEVVYAKVHVIESKSLDRQEIKVKLGESVSEISFFDGESFNLVPKRLKDYIQDEFVYEPALILNDISTISITRGWGYKQNKYGDIILQRDGKVQKSSYGSMEFELFTNRFFSIASQMGSILQRSSFSVNIKERLDFSCAILDENGKLVINAPHIPVHLGSLGVCVRSCNEKVTIKEGDIVITNHPEFGGSHLPDISLIKGVFYDGELICYLANRSHHSEIGGKSPGSMPADAKLLKEEGVIIRPMKIMENNNMNWDGLKSIFENAAFPTRSWQENEADINAAIASLVSGENEIIKLIKKYGSHVVKKNLSRMITHSSKLIDKKISTLNIDDIHEVEPLDDGSQIKWGFKKEHDNKWVFDFSGTSKQKESNLNATPAIVQSVILYVLRLLVDEDIPLNEGLLGKINIVLPPSFLNPRFDTPDLESPAVVGGNTEVSQRLVDSLLKGFGLAACSQGTMNNFLFGNDSFGYYETICGGVGAIDGLDGADAVHQHMTNTKITDPEILEYRYPICLDEFAIRKGSGGGGKWKGGDGVVRKFRFLEDLKITLLSQHRKISPYGLKGGSEGQKGSQYIIKNEKKYALSGVFSHNVNKGDIFVIETPGGGGFGDKIHS